ncbi:hypothetical protein F5Y15DRAFT_93766 [Xylariaceae sp. FL0016]|nr:hypothetical protein F5Y15DRAFT_93766 [Xylariaceae sp. FL0016]
MGDQGHQQSSHQSLTYMPLEYQGHTEEGSYNPGKTAYSYVTDHNPTFYDSGTPREQVEKSQQDPSYLDGGYKGESRALSSPSRLKNAMIWWSETLACFLSLVALFAIVATAYPHLDQPIPEWPFKISINALISIYIVVLKTMIVTIISQGLGQLKWSWFREPRPLKDLETFDEASRGIWGAFGLLCVARGRRLILTIGAVIIILATILDPFGQQLIHFYSCNVPDQSANASIPTNNVLDVGLAQHIGAGLNALSTDMQAALTVATYDDELKQVSFSCSSGNCTIPARYRSSGFCSRCTDISDDVVITKTPLSDIVTNESYWNLSLPSFGLTTQSDLAGTLVMKTTLAGETPYASDSGVSVTLLKQTISDRWVNGSSLNAPGACDHNNTWTCKNYGAATCNLYPCVQTYSADIHTGVLSENIVSEDTVWSYTSTNSMGSVVDIQCLNNAEKQSLRRSGYSFTDDTEILGFNLTYYATEVYKPGLANDEPSILNATATNIRPKCIYQDDYFSILSLENWFSGIFNGTAAWGPDIFRICLTSAYTQ